MSKSRGNTIPPQATADATAALIKGFKADTDRYITFDPEHRPEVSNVSGAVPARVPGGPAAADPAVSRFAVRAATAGMLRD